MDDLKKEIAHIQNQKTNIPISLFMYLKEVNNKNMAAAVKKVTKPEDQQKVENLSLAKVATMKMD